MILKASLRLLFLSISFVSICVGGEPIGDDALGVVRSLEPPAVRPEVFEMGFGFQSGDTIALLGGTDMVLEQNTGYLETALTLAWSDRDLKFRYLGWQADTAFRQQRPLYFFDAEHRDPRQGSTFDERQRVRPQVILVEFGKMESLEGVDALPAFREAYGNLLDALNRITPRIVVFSPPPFFKTGPAADLAAQRNQTLTLYSRAMQELAEVRSFIFVDGTRLGPDSTYSDNGIHLNDAGRQAMASLVLKQLAPKARRVDFSDPKVEQLREAIVDKNKVWHQYHRPTNWAFLYGDRQSVPASRDQMDSEKRWFPYEIERTLTLVSTLEDSIHEMAR
ncbi:MAG: hypothetical protein KJT03_01115 [Verrucomicrobiae bacterium]|nr:hypothetical protein [Verrucomicrobiae bacterium]